MRQIGEIIKRRRTELGYTLQAVIDRMDTDYDTGNLSRLERGKQKYTEELLTSLAKALDTTLSSLYAEAEGRPHLSADAQRIIDKFAQASAKGTLTPESMAVFEGLIGALKNANQDTSKDSENAKSEASRK